MREDRKKRNRRDRRGARTAAAGRSAVMTLENGSLLIRVPEELDHHSGADLRPGRPADKRAGRPGGSL